MNLYNWINGQYRGLTPRARYNIEKAGNHLLAFAFFAAMIFIAGVAINDAPGNKPKVSRQPFLEPIVHAQEITPTPTPSVSPVAAKTDDIDQIVDKVRILESSGGINDNCKKRGMVNGFGYAQNDHTWRCYASLSEVRQLVHQWFEAQLKTKTMAESLCYYNLGKPITNCWYYQQYQKLGG